MLWNSPNCIQIWIEVFFSALFFFIDLVGWIVIIVSNQRKKKSSIRFSHCSNCWFSACYCLAFFFAIVSKRRLIFQLNFLFVWYRKYFHGIFTIQHLSWMRQSYLKLSTFTSHFRVASWCIQTKTFLIIHSDVFFACSRIWCDEFGKIGCRISGMTLFQAYGNFPSVSWKKSDLYLVWLCWKFSDVTINIFVLPPSPLLTHPFCTTYALFAVEKCISACLQ